MQEDIVELVSEFPPPPKYFEYFDKKESLTESDWALLHQPPPPMSPTYHQFGVAFSTKDSVPDLISDRTDKLYLSSPADDIDYKQQLIKLNKSLLANFIQLVGVLINKPDLFNQKLDDVEMLFLNMHNLINSFRPHQARAQIIELLKQQIKDRREATKEIRECIEESKATVEAAHVNLSSSSSDMVDDIEEDFYKDLEIEDKNGTADDSTDLEDKRIAEANTEEVSSQHNSMLDTLQEILDA